MLASSSTDYLPVFFAGAFGKWLAGLPCPCWAGPLPALFSIIPPTFVLGFLSSAMIASKTQKARTWATRDSAGPA